MYYSMGFDPTYFLVLIGVAICLLASSRMNSTFNKYARIRNRTGITGREAAETILQSAGLYDVQVKHVNGNLTDHYNPATKVLNLSDATYNVASVAALGVAAHECGHAVQHATAYAPLTLRTTFVPIANLGSKLAWPLILIGLFLNNSSSYMLIMAGVIAFSMAVLFQIITLPVEFNASSRALELLGSNGLLYQDEVGHAKKVLHAAAMTYVASAASMLLQLLRLLLIANNNRRR